MAISDSRLSLSNITDVPLTNYTTVSDTESINRTRSLSDTYFSNNINDTSNNSLISSIDNVTSPLDMLDGTGTLSGMMSGLKFGNQDAASVLGIFSTSCNGSGLSARQRGNYYRNNRNLGYGGSSLCNNTRQNYGMDAVLGNINNIGNIGSANFRLPLSSIDTLTNMINSKATELFGGFIGGLISIPVCLLGGALNALLKGLGKVGSSLANRLGLSNLLNSDLAKCLSTAYNNMVSNNAISTAVTGSMINHMSGSDINTSSIMMDGLVGSGSNYDGIYRGFGSSLSTENDGNMENKLLLLNGVKENDPNNTSLSQAYTRGSIDNVMSSLDSSSPSSSKNESGNYDNVITGLSNVNSNWNKDSSGDVNYYRANDNSRLSTLSEASVTGNGETNVSGSYKQPLSEAETIFTLNSVA